MHNLSRLSGEELENAEAACEILLDLHRKREVLEPELFTRLDTALADIHMTQEDRQRAERGGS